MIKIRNYTDEEIKYIENNYYRLTVKQIAEKINKTESSVSNAVRKLGLKKQEHKIWTDKENDFLKENYMNMTNEEISIKLNRSFNSISAQMDCLGLVRNKSWTSEEEQYLIDNFKYMSHKELGEKLGRTERAVTAKCFELNLYKKEIPWTKEEINFIKNNYMEMSNNEIAKVLSRSENAIHLKASKMGLKKYPYFCDYHYFEKIDTEEKAYWLGFLTADGWISKNETSNAGTVGIELQYSDMNHLKKFNKSIGGNYQITDRWKACLISTKYKNKKHHMCVIRIFSLIMYNSLIALGFSNNKTYDCSIPILKKDLIRHYMRGYFDGDGCFTLTNKSFHISFITASKKLNHDIYKILQDEEIVASSSDYINDFGTKIYMLYINRNLDKIKFLDYIYKDSSIYLDRKYKKYLKAKEKYNHGSLAA